MRLALNDESVRALREFADVLPITIDNIRHDTEKLINTYVSVSELVGVHNSDFQIMLLHIQKASLVASESLEILPNIMRMTADRIEGYIYNVPQTENESGGDSDANPSIGAKVLRKRM